MSQLAKNPHKGTNRAKTSRLVGFFGKIFEC